MISAFWFMGSKIKIGRSPGSGLTEPDEFLVDQGDLFPASAGLSKIEWNCTFAQLLTAKWAYFERLHPRRARGPGRGHRLPDQHRERKLQ
jgi:hypothetical protein